jgi:hypothetical protein
MRRMRHVRYRKSVRVSAAAAANRAARAVGAITGDG